MLVFAMLKRQYSSLPQSILQQVRKGLPNFFNLGAADKVRKDSQDGSDNNPDDKLLLPKTRGRVLAPLLRVC